METTTRQELLDLAIAGEGEPLGRLLFAERTYLMRHIEAKLSAKLRGVVGADDILQQTYVQAFRDIRRFRDEGKDSFRRWLVTIAEHRLLDAVKAHSRKKRGGDRQRVHQPRRPEKSTFADLLDLLSDRGQSPSTIAARREAEAALAIELAALNDDYRNVIRLRFLEGKCLDDVARAMNRTPDAVRGLLFRAQKKLRERMGHTSQWLRKG